MQAIRIEVYKDITKVIYIDNGNKIFNYDSPIGDEYVSSRKYSRHAASDWMSYIHWCLSCISYVDRIPATFYLSTNGNSVWYSSILSKASYAQFYMPSLPRSSTICVIIDDNNSSTTKNERYQNTLSKFKI